VFLPIRRDRPGGLSKNIALIPEPLRGRSEVPLALEEGSEQMTGYLSSIRGKTD
jgi:hypothetical protein